MLDAMFSFGNSDGSGDGGGHVKIAPEMMWKCAFHTDVLHRTYVNMGFYGLCPFIRIAYFSSPYFGYVMFILIGLLEIVIAKLSN